MHLSSHLLISLLLPFSPVCWVLFLILTLNVEVSQGSVPGPLLFFRCIHSLGYLLITIFTLKAPRFYIWPQPFPWTWDPYLTVCLYLTYPNLTSWFFPTKSVSPIVFPFKLMVTSSCSGKKCWQGPWCHSSFHISQQQNSWFFTFEIYLESNHLSPFLYLPLSFRPPSSLAWTLAFILLPLVSTLISIYVYSPMARKSHLKFKYATTLWIETR